MMMNLSRKSRNPREERAGREEVSESSSLACRSSFWQRRRRLLTVSFLKFGPFVVHRVLWRAKGRERREGEAGKEGRKGDGYDVGVGRRLERR